MTEFKTQADIWRYLLESEDNKAINKAINSKEIFGLKDGVLWHWGEDRPVHLTFAVPAVWRPYVEEKCWLDEQLEPSSPLSEIDRHRREALGIGARALAHEAIKRIEAHYNHLNNQTAVEILKELIGEK